MRKLLLALTVSVGLLFAQSAVSDVLRSDHPTEYVVVKGDTLWDISARFLEKPWLWPEIWQKNPQVKNPHWIYPGDVIRLIYVDGKPMLTINQQPSANINQAPVGAIDMDLYSRPFLKDLRVVTSFQELPYVIGLNESRMVVAGEEPIYVQGLQGVAIGESVEIFRPSRNFARNYQQSYQRTATAELNRRGDRKYLDGTLVWQGISTSPNSSDYIGTEMVLVAKGKVSQVSGELTRVMLTDIIREVRQGDRVTPDSRSGYDPYYFPSKGPDIGLDNRIMAVSDSMVAGGRWVVAIPVGSKQGVRNGNTYDVWSQGATVPDRIEHSNEIAAQLDKVNMFREKAGTIMVFRTFENVSYAVVMLNALPVKVGDYLKNPN
jgi:hypothetical protein